MADYSVMVDVLDNECLTLSAVEKWPDGYKSDAKSIGEIIINAANYASAPAGKKPNAEHWSYFDRVLWVEPRHQT